MRRGAYFETETVASNGAPQKRVCKLELEVLSLDTTPFLNIPDLRDTHHYSGLEFSHIPGSILD
jgi:hypothetical protein